MKMSKRIISILLSLMLVLGAVAVGGVSASALDGSAQLSIGNVTAIRNGAIMEREGTGWSFTETENGITLNLDNLDLTITGSAKLTRNYQNAISLSSGSLTLNGDFTVLGSTLSSLSVSEILTVEGGSLNVINTGNDDAVFVSFSSQFLTADDFLIRMISIE